MPWLNGGRWGLTHQEIDGPSLHVLADLLAAGGGEYGLASQQVIELLSANAPAPGSNVIIGGRSMAEMMGQTAAPDPTEQLTKLADLHENGVLSDDEFAAEKARILAG